MTLSPTEARAEIVRIALERRGETRTCLWPAPFNQDTPEAAWLFVQECRSYLETTGEVLPLPSLDYLKAYVHLWHECKREGKMLFTQKCRRMVISWCARALELHQMGLGRCDQILAGEDLEAAAKHVWRLEHLYTDLQRRHPDWKLPAHKHLLYAGDRKLKMFGLANGSICNSANGESGSLQGDGTRIITLEEPAQYRYLADMVPRRTSSRWGRAVRRGKASWSTSSPTRRRWTRQRLTSSGDSKRVGMTFPKGFEVRDMPSGAVYLRLHHYADPEKGADWLEEERQRMIATPEQFRREILMDETLTGGQPIYSNYDDDFHVYRIEGKEAYIPILPNSLYFGGWDCGQTLQPAFVLYQVLTSPFQVHALAEVTSSGGEAMSDFAPRVLSQCMRVIPGHWDEIRHYGDATVNTRSGTNKQTARDEAKKHGISIKAVSNVWAPRVSAMSWLLSRRLDMGKPGFKIDALRCPMLRRAMQGAYKYRTKKDADPNDPNAVILEPDKNLYSHVAEAAQYPAIYIRKMLEGSGARLQEQD